jgi:ubiquinone/menaquinone biosynthesis C-methylase UbiE
MNLLDCGCGPGTITVGLAERVAPGMAIGLDIEPLQVARARALADQTGLTSLRFVVGNVLTVPFPDALFDVVFAHNTLEHLSKPIEAMKEMKRLLKPGGLVAIRDPDLSTIVMEPPFPLILEASSLLLRVREYNGSSQCYARHQRQLLLEAGFVRTEAFAFADYSGNENNTRAFADTFIEVLQSPALLNVAVSRGWVDHSKLEEMIDALRAWSERPDCFNAVMDCAAIGWSS